MNCIINLLDRIWSWGTEYTLKLWQRLWWSRSALIRGSMEDRVRFLMAAEAGELAHPMGLVAWVRWGSQTNSIHLTREFLLWLLQSRSCSKIWFLDLEGDLV